MNDIEDTGEPENRPNAQGDQNRDDSDNTSTDARDTLDGAVDKVPDGDEGQVKSRDPEYYGDR